MKLLICVVCCQIALFHVSFSASFASCYSRLSCPIFPLKILYGKPELSTTIINIITSSIVLGLGRASGLGVCV